MALSIKDLDILEFAKGYDERVEKIILGNMLVIPNAIKDVAAVVKVDDFYIGSHRKIYQAILTSFDESNQTIIIPVKKELERIGELNNIGGLDYLVDLVEIGSSDRYIRRYVEYIKKRC